MLLLIIILILLFGGGGGYYGYSNYGATGGVVPLVLVVLVIWLLVGRGGLWPFAGARINGQGVSPMTLVNIAVILVVVGLVMWLINTYIPMAGAIKSLLNIVVFVVVLIWVLQTFGMIGSIRGLKMPALTWSAITRKWTRMQIGKDQIDRPKSNHSSSNRAAFVARWWVKRRASGRLPPPSVPADFFDFQLFNCPIEETNNYNGRPENLRGKRDDIRRYRKFHRPKRNGSGPSGGR
jgi:hypothetical protein